MDNFILNFDDFKKYHLTEKYKFRYTAEQQLVIDVLRTLATSLIILGGIGGALSSLKGYLVTVWDHESKELKKDPEFRKEEPKNALQRWWRKNHIYVILGLAAGIGVLAGIGVYKLFNLPPEEIDNAGPKFTNLHDYLDNKFKSDESSVFNLNTYEVNIKGLLNKVDAAKLASLLKHDEKILHTLSMIASDTKSKKAVIGMAIELDKYIKSKLTKQEIDVLTEIGDNIPARV